MNESDQTASPPARQQAEDLLQRGFAAQMQGKLRQALSLYTRSIEAFPTAEAYTFRGWTYSFQGNYERAIEECRQAIKLDPLLGNPYNDIGAYLVEVGRPQEAIPWLRKALHAPHYAHRCFSEFNLGRAYERQKQWRTATLHYRKALAMDPGYQPAQRALHRVKTLKTGTDLIFPGCFAAGPRDGNP